MGVPALFRWLSRKYPKITSKVTEEFDVTIKDVKIPVDLTQPNPNGIEFDNLYLDMNGIVHPCTHPEDRPPPETEDEAMLLIFEYIDRIMSMIRPRQVLYMAIDGVAPRAKMNQQRSRRFRAALDAKQIQEEEDAARKRLEDGGLISAPKQEKQKFDSNCITPGTPFMKRLSECLRFYIAERINKRPGWSQLKVVLSDASVPGEGEHKIMDFVRKQRLSPKYNPNTTHVIYGLDADLIMLSLATHEPHFYVLREDVFASDARDLKCEICSQPGHKAKDCTGQIPEYKPGQENSKINEIPPKPFVFLHVEVLREYLEFEMRVKDLPFAFDLERALDDWVFLCFFVGNDFLPHLPSLEIREGAIDLLIDIYKKKLPNMGGYLTKNGNANLELVQSILQELGEQEDEIFRKRKENEERYKRNAERRKIDAELATTAVPYDRLHDVTISMKRNSSGKTTGFSKTISSKTKETRNEANAAVALALKASLKSSINKQSEAVENGTDDGINGSAEIIEAGSKRKQDDVPSEVTATEKIFVVADEEDRPVPVEADSEDIVEPIVTESQDISVVETVIEKVESESVDSIEETAESVEEEEIAEEELETDDVRLWEPGWKERYYQSKFGVDVANSQFRKQVMHVYVEGLCWVLKYYYQGCASWKWYYPYHYSPFASDITVTDLTTELKIKFDIGRPFAPLEQLMGVLPAASRSHIPGQFHKLMTDQDSAIIDFYPESFSIDLNGKKNAWQGVVILPFIEEKRLLKSMNEVYANLDEESSELNKTGDAIVFTGPLNKALYNFFCDVYTAKDMPKGGLSINPAISQGFTGTILPYKDAVMPGSTVYSPLLNMNIPDLPDNSSICTLYFDPRPPRPDYEYPAIILPGVKFSAKKLTYDDFMASQGAVRRNNQPRGGYDTRREGRYDDRSNSRHAMSGGADYASKDRRDSNRRQPQSYQQQQSYYGQGQQYYGSNSNSTPYGSNTAYTAANQYSYYYPQQQQQQYQNPQVYGQATQYQQSQGYANNVQSQQYQYYQAPPSYPGQQQSQYYYGQQGQYQYQQQTAAVQNQYYYGYQQPPPAQQPQTQPSAPQAAQGPTTSYALNRNMQQRQQQSRPPPKR